MSNRRKPRRDRPTPPPPRPPEQQRPEPGDPDAVWIKTEPSLDGSTYVVTIEASEDRAVTLTPDRALRHASEVLSTVARAEYDAAVFAQMSALGNLEPEAVGQLILDLRRDRPNLDPEATQPLRLEPGVNASGKPFLALYLDDRQVGQWGPADARRHALGVIEAVHAADLDSGYYRALTGLVGLEEPRARNVIDDLIKHRVEV